VKYNPPAIGELGALPLRSMGGHRLGGGGRLCPGSPGKEISSGGCWGEAGGLVVSGYLLWM
jgi:hypothetical protein